MSGEALEKGTTKTSWETVTTTDDERVTITETEVETAVGKLKSRTEWQAFLVLVGTLLANAFANHFLGVEVLDQDTLLKLLGAYGTYGVTVAARKFGKGSR